MNAIRLRTEYLENPLGIDIPHPRLMWNCFGGKRQTADRARLLRIALLAVAVMMIVAGTFNGSARDVFGKAVKICTECIGLG